MKAWGALLGVLGTLGVAAAFAVPVAFAGSPHVAVTFCHRTGSETNPYVVITTDDDAWNRAHSNVTGSHPTLNGNDDFIVPEGTTKDQCDAKNPPPKE